MSQKKSRADVGPHLLGVNFESEVERTVSSKLYFLYICFFLLCRKE